MDSTIDHECPDCGTEEFYRTARTELHLGRKVKWSCAECEYGFVRINDAVDTISA